MESWQPSLPSVFFKQQQLFMDERRLIAESTISDMRTAFAAGFMPILVGIGLDRILDAMQEREQHSLSELFAKLVKGGAIPSKDFLAGQQKKLDQLSDLM